MKRIVGTFSGAALVGLLVLGLLAVPSGASPAAASAACAPATNIEAIIDDSGSMSITDPNRLRVQAMDLLIQTLPSATTLGAIEFGSGYEGIPGIFEGKPAADTVFSPEPIGPNATSMQAALKASIDAENGATDYNGAFAKADEDNPNSDARIFLTDGGHDVGTYNEAHLAHNVPTYVIGFGTAFTSTEDKARLEKIAKDTGGRLFEPKDASALQAVVNDVGAALTCQTQPRLFRDELAKGQSKTHNFSVGAATKSLQVTLTWANPQSRFKLRGLRLVSHGKLVAVARPHKVRKLQIKVQARSSTFLVLRVAHLRKGRLSFAVKATKVGAGEAKASVTTQIGRGRK